MQETQSFRKSETVDRRHQDSLFHTMAQSSTTYLICMDLERNYRFVNRAYEQRFGPKEQYLGKPYHSTLHPDDLPQYKRGIKKCLQHPGTPVMLELQERTPDDIYYATRWEFVSITDEQDQVTEIQGIGVDITCEKKAELRLRHISQLNQLLLGISTQFINTSHTSLAGTVKEALKHITQFIGFKWGLVYVIDENSSMGNLAHEYTIPQTSSVAKSAHKISTNYYPWWIKKMRSQEIVEIRDIAALPEEAAHEKLALHALGVNVLLGIPIAHQEKLLGYVIFATDSLAHHWTPEVTGSLKLLGTLLSIAFHQIKLHQTLAESRSKYKLLADNVADMVSKHDLQGIYNYVSPSCETLTGFKQHELLGTSALERIHPDDQAKAQKSLQQILSGEVIRYQYRKLLKDGQYRWMEITAKLIVENDKKEIIASTRDIHQRKVTEDANTKLLRKSQRLNKDLKASQSELQITLARTQELNELLLKSEKKFRSLTEKSFDAIVVCNKDGLITYATPSVQNVVGYTSEELLGTYQWNYIFSEDLSVSRELLSGILNQPRKRTQGFTRLVRKDGQVIWTETIMTNLLLDESIQGVVYNFRDVTEQRKGEQAIAEYSERLAIATHSANIGIWDWYIPKNFLMWDERALAMFGVDPDKFTHDERSWLEAIHPEDKKRVQQEINRALETAQDFDTEYRIIHSHDQEERHIKAHAKITREQGKPIRMTGVNLDITNIKLVEQQLRENNEALRKTNAELDQFVYSTSHNLRAPLASVLGLISLLQGTTAPEERTQYLQLVESSIHRLDETIHEIIDYSRNARIDLKNEPIHFRKIIVDILDSLYFLRSAIDIQVRLDIPDEITFISDPFRLRIIFNNLISNAIKYFNPHAAQPFVAITVKPKNQAVEVTVEDNGLGINRAAQSKIFNMFYRASHRASGSGLGLYIVKESLQKIGGTISMTSQEGIGTTFTLQLPSLKNDL